MRWLAIPLVGLVALTSPAMAADGLSLYAAGSLKAALTDVAKAYEEVYGAPIEMEFAASGLLPERIEGGEHADVFASANKAHPQALMAKGLGGPVALFARNRLCALAQPDVVVDSANLLEVMLRPDVKLGTSTPKADPSGDCAWQVFEGGRAASGQLRAARRQGPEAHRRAGLGNDRGDHVAAPTSTRTWAATPPS